MATNPQPQKGRVGALLILDATIEALNLAKEVSSVTPAKAIFGSVSVLLGMIKVCRFLPCDEELPIHFEIGLYG